MIIDILNSEFYWLNELPGIHPIYELEYYLKVFPDGTMIFWRTAMDEWSQLAPFHKVWFPNEDIRNKYCEKFQLDYHDYRFHGDS